METPLTVESAVVAILIVGMVFLIIATSAFILNEFGEAVELEPSSSSQTILSDNGTGTTLSPVGEGVTSYSATVKNRTWLSFDGVNDDVDKVFTLEDDQNHTFSLWFNATGDQNNDDSILIWMGINQEGLQIRKSLTGRIEYFKSNSTVIRISSPNSVNDSQWHHVVTTLNEEDGNISLYIDGELVNSTIVAGTLNSQMATFGLTYNGNIYEYKGSMDEVRFYQRVLTPPEVLEIYNSGRHINSTLVTSGLTYYLPLNEGTGTDVHSLNETDLT